MEIQARVPVQTLIEYLEAGDPLDDFLKDFPSVTREHAIAVLELAKTALLAKAADVYAEPNKIRIG